MDDDPVLRSLGAQLERDDPDLAALLSGGTERTHRGHPWWLLFLAVPLVFGAALWLGPAVLGVTALVLGLAAPLVVAFWCMGRDDPSGG
jgi:hypothetical protein